MKAPSRLERQALEDIHQFHDPWHQHPKGGRSREAGHWNAAVAETVKKGWATRTNSARYFLTDLGRQALGVKEEDAPRP